MLGTWRDARIGLLILALATVALSLLLGMQHSLLFFAEHGVMAMLMAEMLRRQQSVEKTLLAATGASLLMSGLVLAVFLWSAQLDLWAVRQHLEDSLSQAVGRYLGEGDKASEAQLLPYIEEGLALVIRILPALLIMSTAAGAVLNYSVARILWGWLGGAPPLFPATSLARWRAPEPCVWVLIAGGIFSFLPIPLLQIGGLNVVLLVSFIYLVQGLAITVFYLNKGSVPAMFRVLAYLFLGIQPLLLLGVAAFGLFDLWCDFRHLRHKREEP
ncbi:MAG: DUF2232 domain-containing protein [Nitrospinae bacterium]|nr:DUF2232 domain-containing protein [Nitrospinota bacterium]